MIAIINGVDIEKDLDLFNVHTRGKILTTVNNIAIVKITRLEFANLKQLMEIREADEWVTDKIKRDMKLYEISFIGRCEESNFKEVVRNLDGLIKSLGKRLFVINLVKNNKMSAYISGYCKRNNIIVDWYSQDMGSAGLTNEKNYYRFMELSDYVFIVEGKYQNYDKYRFKANFNTNYKILKLD